MMFPDLIKDYTILGITPGNFAVSQVGLSMFRQGAETIMSHVKPFMSEHFTNGNGELRPYFEALGSSGGAIGKFFKNHPDYAPVAALSAYGIYRIQQRFFGYPPPKTMMQRLQDGLCNEKYDLLTAIGDKPLPTLGKALAVATIGKMFYDYYHKKETQEKTSNRK